MEPLGMGGVSGTWGFSEEIEEGFAGLSRRLRRV